jgi:hypothetical protein
LASCYFPKGKTLEVTATSRFSWGRARFLAKCGSDHNWKVFLRSCSSNILVEMSVEIDPYELYNERVSNPDCYVDWRGRIAVHLNNRRERLGHEVGNKDVIHVAHGLLEFGRRDGVGDIECMPWLVAPDAPRRKVDGNEAGRHMVVASEFRNKIVDDGRLVPDRSFGRDYVGTYGFREDGQNLCLAPYFGGPYFKDNSNRDEAIGRILDTSKHLPTVKFYLELKSMAWLILKEGEILEQPL